MKGQQSHHCSVSFLVQMMFPNRLPCDIHPPHPSIHWSLNILTMSYLCVGIIKISVCVWKWGLFIWPRWLTIILLPHPLEYWDSRYMPPHLASHLHLCVCGVFSCEETRGKYQVSLLHCSFWRLRFWKAPAILWSLLPTAVGLQPYCLCGCWRIKLRWSQAPQALILEQPFLQLSHLHQKKIFIY